MTKWNCRVRLKRTKDGKITAIHRNTVNKKRIDECNDILEQAKLKNLTSVMITGFAGDTAHVLTSTINYGDGLIALENLKKTLDDGD